MHETDTPDEEYFQAVRWGSEEAASRKGGRPPKETIPTTRVVLLLRQDVADYLRSRDAEQGQLGLAPADRESMSAYVTRMVRAQSSYRTWRALQKETGR